ncbi:MAG: ABC transporter permease [Alphaproteobacteria bacterium]|nr:ABC transporter permease [Alphaproteobacteria bacterium]
MIGRILKEAWISIAAYKLRTFLTTLGIMIGVSAVVLMVAVGQTVQNVIDESFASIGGNLLVVLPGASTSGGIRTAMGRPTVSRDDMDAIKKLKDVMTTSYATTSNVQVVYGKNNWNANIIGTTPDYLTVGNWEIERGIGLTDRDMKTAASYVILGQSVIDELFGMANPIGKTVRLQNIPFRVIGTLKAKGAGLMGDDQDNIIIMPFTTLRQKIRGARQPQMVGVGFVKVDAEEKLDPVQQRVTYLLRSRHHLKENQEDDFTVHNMAQLVDQIKTVGLYLSLLLGAIASISLLVGSIGIMNMMLVSVTERTREIGIRKALGAPNRWIMFQFLTESIVISCMGSLMGLIIGVALSQVGGLIFDKNVPISMWTVVVSASVAVVVGVASGLFPAIKAMKLDPIDALRYQ